MCHPHPHPPPSTATTYPPDTAALWGGATVCVCVCAWGMSVYACVFVCLCGMAGQRNALAHAWLSRHNGAALSHCREIPLWYAGSERVKEEEMPKPKCLQLSEKLHSSIQNCGLCLFTCVQFTSTRFFFFFFFLHALCKLVNPLALLWTHTLTHKHSYFAVFHVLCWAYLDIKYVGLS